jgi:hypothetical protein
LHLSARVVRKCNELGAYFHVIPAGTTHLLQPLDVVIFSRLKRYLRREYLRVMALREVQDLPDAPLVGAGPGPARRRPRCMELSTALMLHILGNAIVDYLPTLPLQKAFAETGLGERQGEASAYLLRELGLEGPPAVLTEFPSAESLRAVYPRGFDVPLAALLDNYMPPPPPLAALPPLPPPLALPAPPPREPVRRRVSARLLERAAGGAPGSAGPAGASAGTVPALPDSPALDTQASGRAVGARVPESLRTLLDRAGRGAASGSTETGPGPVHLSGAASSSAAR